MIVHRSLKAENTAISQGKIQKKCTTNKQTEENKISFIDHIINVYMYMFYNVHISCCRNGLDQYSQRGAQTPQGGNLVVKGGNSRFYEFVLTISSILVI